MQFSFSSEFTFTYLTDGCIHIDMQGTKQGQTVSGVLGGGC